MAVKIRLTRKGKKKQPTYRVVVADSRAPRDGRYIEQIGRYDPRPDPSEVLIDNERAAYWLSQGAQPSDAVRKLLEISGALAARKVREGRVHVVGEEAQQQAAAEEAEAAAAAAAEVETADEPELDEAAEANTAGEAAAEAVPVAAAEAGEAAAEAVPEAAAEAGEAAGADDAEGEEEEA
jgi:small subunit ribosomal protein S16